MRPSLPARREEQTNNVKPNINEIMSKISVNKSGGYREKPNIPKQGVTVKRRRYGEGGSN